MINQNDIRWEDFSKADQEDMLSLRDAILEFEKNVRIEKITLLNTISFEIQYTAQIMDFFQFSTFVEVRDFKYDTLGKTPSEEEMKWLDILSDAATKGSDLPQLLEKQIDTNHLVQLKDEVCNSIAKRNNISVNELSTEFFLDYEITVLQPFGE